MLSGPAGQSPTPNRHQKQHGGHEEPADASSTAAPDVSESLSVLRAFGFCGTRRSLRSEEDDPLFSKREVASTRPLPWNFSGNRWQPVATDLAQFGGFRR